MSFETFNTTQSAAADTNLHLQGDTWRPPVQVAKADVNAGNDKAKFDNEAKPAGDKNQPEQQADQTQDKPTEVQHTQEQIDQMVKDASEGRLNHTAREQLLNGLTSGGMDGLVKAAQNLNKLLEAAGTDYRLSFAGLVNRQTGEIMIGAALTKPNENHGAIISDIIRNGENSTYKDRGMVIRMTPSPPGQEI